MKAWKGMAEFAVLGGETWFQNRLERDGWMVFEKKHH